MGWRWFCYRWSLIAGRLPGRTDNEIKNYWNTHIRRKLLNRGIDPATHRPINEPIISFSPAPAKEEEEEEEEISNGFVCKKEKSPVGERCPDLNLDLRISPPYQQQPEPLRSGGRSICFSCSLGLQNSKDCSCSSGTNGSGISSFSSDYDFLGLKTNVFDYRSLEMK